MPGLAPRCLALALATTALAACGGDDAACAPGNQRAGAGHACAAPGAAIVVDGDTADWASLPLLPVAPACRVESCAGAAADALQLARTTDAIGRDALAFRVRLAGGATPALDGGADFVVELRATSAYPTPTIDRLIFGPGHEPRYERNDFVVEPPLGLALPYELAVTADGFEGSFATAGLPFPYGAQLSVYAVTTDPGSDFRRALVDPAPLARACWSEAPGEDPCEGAP